MWVTGVQTCALPILRSSDRIRAQHNADATQMERAMAWAERRHSLPGTSLDKRFSILSFSDQEIVDKASKLGVSLGSSVLSANVSASLIKKSELTRSGTMLQNNLNDKYDDQPHSLILNRASCLTEDLEEDDISRSLEDRTDFSIQSEKVKRTRKKRVYSNSKKRRSDRIKLQKININA